jgi:hypothetical protein
LFLFFGTAGIAARRRGIFPIIGSKTVHKTASYKPRAAFAARTEKNTIKHKIRAKNKPAGACLH